MKKYYILLLILALFLGCQVPSQSSDKNKEKKNENETKKDEIEVVSGAMSITRHGITWHFEDVYEYGQYVNGDYWVVGPVNLVYASYDTQRQEILNCRTIINPRWGIQGYETRITVNNSIFHSDPQLAVDFNAGAVTINPGNSVVTVTRFTDAYISEQGIASYLADAAVLTIVDVSQSDDKFRPPYVRPGRIASSASDNLIFSKTDIQWGLLPKLSKPVNTPEITNTEKLCERIWLDHMPTNIGAEQMPPLNNYEGYGREFSQRVSEIALQLVLNYSDEEKQKLIYSLIQQGIDYYGCILDGGFWPADAGLHNGRKFPVIFAALMLDNNDIKNFPRTYKIAANGEAIFRFSEDGQTYYYDASFIPEYIQSVYNELQPQYSYREQCSVPADPNNPPAGVFKIRETKGWVDLLNSGDGDIVLWRCAQEEMGNQSALYEHLHINDWFDHPAIDRKKEAYRNVASGGWVGIGLAIFLIGDPAITLWDHNEFLDYVIRWMNQDRTAIKILYDNKYYPNEYNTGRISGPQFLIQFVEEMWQEYGAELVPFKTN